MIAMVLAVPLIWWAPRQPHGRVGQPHYAKSCVDVGWRCGTYTGPKITCSSERRCFDEQGNELKRTR